MNERVCKSQSAVTATKQKLNMSSPEVKHYVLQLGATKEERYCLSLWLRDGHDICEIPYPKDWYTEDIPVGDFITSIRMDNTGFSYYHPAVQTYLKKLNLSRRQKKRIKRAMTEDPNFDCEEYLYDDELNREYRQAKRNLTKYGIDLLYHFVGFDVFNEICERMDNGKSISDISFFSADPAMSITETDSESDSLPF